jgi:hypothetical protein
VLLEAVLRTKVAFFGTFMRIFVMLEKSQVDYLLHFRGVFREKPKICVIRGSFAAGVVA